MVSYKPYSHPLESVWDYTQTDINQQKDFERVIQGRFQTTQLSESAHHSAVHTTRLPLMYSGVVMSLCLSHYIQFNLFI